MGRSCRHILELGLTKTKAIGDRLALRGLFVDRLSDMSYLARFVRVQIQVSKLARTRPVSIWQMEKKRRRYNSDKYYRCPKVGTKSTEAFYTADISALLVLDKMFLRWKALALWRRLQLFTGTSRILQLSAQIALWLKR